MTIPEATLEGWSNRGATDGAQSLHNAIRDAISAYAWAPGRRPDVYLQGSYRNSTNIRGDSDVDVVVQTPAAFRSDTTALGPAQKSLYEATYPDTTYTWTQFREEVLQALVARFGASAVTVGKKTLKVLAGQGRLHGDVIVAFEYRRFLSFTSPLNPVFVEGLTFFVPTENRWVVNFPKVHYQRGTEKHERTKEMFKPTVRMFKNARRYMVERQAIDRELAPSYFIECFVSNVADSHFLQSTWQLAFSNVLVQLYHLDKAAMMCQHGQFPLCGDNPELWDVERAERFVSALLSLWTDWG